MKLTKEQQDRLIELYLKRIDVRTVKEDQALDLKIKQLKESYAKK